MKRWALKLFALSFFALLCGMRAHAQCSSTAYGGFTCVSTIYNYQTSTTSATATITGVTAGDTVVVDIIALSTTGTLSITSGSGSCSGNIKTYGGNVGLTSGNALVLSTAATSTASCSIVIADSSSNTIAWQMYDIQGTNGAVDVSGNLVSLGSITSGATASCPAVTTTVNGDLVLCLMIDAGNNGATFTATSPFTFLAGTHSMGAEADAQSTAGSITPQFKYSHTGVLGAATIALESGAALPTFSLASGTYNTFLPRANTIDSSTSGVTICYTTNGTTPAASTPGTCSNGMTLANNTAINMPSGSYNLEAIATKSGLNNSIVTSTAYTITPTAASINGMVVGAAPGNISQLGGVFMNPYASFISTLNGLEMPFTAVPVTNFINFSGCTNGSAPTTACLGNSYYGSTMTFSISGIGAGLTVSNAVAAGNLPKPILIGSSVYWASGTLGELCTTSSTEISNLYCGHTTATFSSGIPIASLGFWLEANCPANNAVDCGANGGLNGGTGYNTIHMNGGGGNCSYNGNFLEDRGANSTNCLAFINSALLRVNVQLSEANAAFTATFTNGSSSISATQSLVANQAVQLSTTGTLPANFNTTSVYFVLPGVTGSSFQLAATQNGLAIVAGSAGSGTQTVTQVDLMTICTGSGFQGFLIGTAYTSAQAVANVWMGVNGEGPQVNGLTFWWGGFALDTAGKISLTECLL